MLRHAPLLGPSKPPKDDSVIHSKINLGNLLSLFFHSTFFHRLSHGTFLHGLFKKSRWRGTWALLLSPKELRLFEKATLNSTKWIFTHCASGARRFYAKSRIQKTLPREKKGLYTRWRGMLYEVEKGCEMEMPNKLWWTMNFFFNPWVCFFGNF